MSSMKYQIIGFFSKSPRKSGFSDSQDFFFALIQFILSSCHPAKKAPHRPKTIKRLWLTACATFNSASPSKVGTTNVCKLGLTRTDCAIETPGKRGGFDNIRQEVVRWRQISSPP